MLIIVGWAIGLPAFGVLSWFFYTNRAAPDALAAVSVLGGAALGIYGIFVFGGDAKDKSKSDGALKLILAADIVLLGLWVQFMAHDVQVDPQRDVVVAYVWDINSGEMFPEGTLAVSKFPHTYVYLAEQIVQTCLAQRSAEEPEEPKVGILASRCGLMPGNDLTQIVLLEYLRVVFEHSWEAELKKMPTLQGGRVGIEKYMAGKPGRRVSRDALIDQLAGNDLARYLNAHYRLTIPPDVQLKVGNGPVRGQSAFRHILFDGRYCDALLLIQGGAAGAKYPNWESTARRTEVDVRLMASCSKELRGHPEMASRVEWVNRLMDTVEDGLSVKNLTMKQ
jgi:hypothetical protein